MQTQVDKITEELQDSQDHLADITQQLRDSQTSLATMTTNHQTAQNQLDAQTQLRATSHQRCLTLESEKAELQREVDGLKQDKRMVQVSLLPMACQQIYNTVSPQSMPHIAPLTSRAFPQSQQADRL